MAGEKFMYPIGFVADVVDAYYQNEIIRRMVEEGDLRLGEQLEEERQRCQARLDRFKSHRRLLSPYNLPKERVQALKVATDLYERWEQIVAPLKTEE